MTGVQTCALPISKNLLDNLRESDAGKKKSLFSKIKKFIAEQDLKSEERYVPELIRRRPIDKDYEEKIAIIGAGPAGLSCAYYLAENGSVIYSEGEYGEGLYILRNGKVGTTRITVQLTRLS